MKTMYSIKQEKKTDSKSGYLNIKSNGFLKLTGSAKDVLLTTLHQLNPRSQFFNDIFDLKTPYETFDLWSLSKWSSSNFFLYSYLSTEIEWRSVTLISMIFCIRVMPCPQTRAEVRCNLEYFVASTQCHPLGTDNFLILIYRQYKITDYRDGARCVEMHSALASIV